MNPILDGWTPPARPMSPRQPGAAVTRLSLVGEITVEGAIELFAAIRAANGNSIEIDVDSIGGNALCGLALFEILIAHPHEVVARVVGRCSSGAVIAVMGADRRFMSASSTMLLHGTHGPAEWREHVDDLAAGILAEATGRAHHLVEVWRAGETRFNAAEAIAAGLAHEVVHG